MLAEAFSAHDRVDEARDAVREALRLVLQPAVAT